MASLVAALGMLTAVVIAAVSHFNAPVGPLPGGGYKVATGQIVRPAGDAVTFGGRPVDAALSPDGKTLYLKDNRGLVVVDAASWRVRQEWAFPREGGSSLHGIRVSSDGHRVYATGAGSTLWIAKVADDSSVSLDREVHLPLAPGKGASYPCGLAASPDEKTLYVCLSRGNCIVLVDVETGTVRREIPTGIAPFDIALSPDGLTAWVSCWGGRTPRPGELHAPSAGTEVVVDKRGVGASGVVSLLNLTEGREEAQIPVGLHPSDITLNRDGSRLYVACANDDTLQIIDTARRSVRDVLTVRPDPALDFGSAPNALCLSPDEKTLYVACGGNNSVASIALSTTAKAKVKGWIGAGWYPGAVIADTARLYVANIKGNGSRGETEGSANKRGVYQFQGTVSRLSLPTDAELAQMTIRAKADAQVLASRRQQVRARAGRKPVAVPERVGEPSVFKHIVYIIKENRTYDQVLGDLPKGDGDPSLCIYGRAVTPNHHALAEDFVLLDNFYCNGVLSADGHSWVTEGNVTDHLEKAFGGFTRSYTFGDDPLTYSSFGFVWDNVLDHGLTFRNFGEMDYTDETPDSSFGEIWKDWQTGSPKITFKHRMGIDRLRQHSQPDAPGWNMDIPDQIRADVFLRELKQFEAKGSLPNLTVLYLPNDHTTGTTPGDPTPRAYMADNDLALGRVIEGLSRSRFWSKTCVFVIEDDPQDGFDHIDGHRSPAFVVSPYSRRGLTIKNFYNQTSVIHTMEQMFGLAPMNQMDALAPLMSQCFATKPDLRPYACRPAQVPLTETNPKKTALAPKARRLAEQSAALNFRQVDAAREDTLNRILWHAARGTDAPYPAHLAGAHGHGLTSRGLRQEPERETGNK